MHITHVCVHIVHYTCSIWCTVAVVAQVSVSSGVSIKVALHWVVAYQVPIKEFPWIPDQRHGTGNSWILIVQLTMGRCPGAGLQPHKRGRECHRRFRSAHRIGFANQNMQPNKQTSHPSFHHHNADSDGKARTGGERFRRVGRMTSLRAIPVALNHTHLRH